MPESMVDAAIQDKSTGAEDQTIRCLIDQEDRDVTNRSSALVDPMVQSEAVGTEYNTTGSINSSQKPYERENALSHLIRGWENYLSASNEGRPFQPLQQPLQMLQGFGFRNPASYGLSTISSGQSGQSNADPNFYTSLGPSALRHTHSSPNQYIPSIVPYEQTEESRGITQDFPPPPVPLDPFQRSSSTPSAFRNNSSFSTADSSAFTLPPQRISYTGQIYTNPASRHSAFDPVKYYARALEDMERTSIEVTDTTKRIDYTFSCEGANNDLKEDNKNENSSSSDKILNHTKRGAAFRAARFLTDVRVLRRRRRIRIGKEKAEKFQTLTLAEPTIEEENSDCPGIQALKLEAAVTVLTEPDFEYSNQPSIMPDRSENSPKDSDNKQYNQKVFDSSNDSDMSDHDDCKDDGQPFAGHYHQLDSDVDEEDDLYRRIDSQLHVESPSTVPSPLYQNLVDDMPASEEITLKSSSSYKRSSLQFVTNPLLNSHLQVAASIPTVAASPSPTHMDCSEGMSLTPRSNESFTISPGTNRSFATGSSSGDTPNATSTSCSTCQHSGLSTISETDREVMETNKEAKRRRGLDILTNLRKSDNDATSLHSSSTLSTNPNGYLALGGSPVPLRDGANVPVERFFTRSLSSPSTNSTQAPGYLRSTTRSSLSRRSGSVTSPSVTSESVSATNTSTSSEEDPPTFVSYLDRALQSDLTTYREISESCARSDDGDTREPSPAPGDLLPYSYGLLDDPKNREQTIVRPEKFRARPPRSPGKGLQPVKTPPPRGAVSPLYHHQLSPPRKIVDHPDSNISRPYVRRSGVSSFPNPHFTSSLYNHPFCIPESSEGDAQIIMVEPKVTLISNQTLIRGQTYKESNVEVTNSHCFEGSQSKVVTPEKDDNES